MNRNEALAELHGLLGRMDLPDHKKKPASKGCLRWMGRCLKERNGDKPGFTRAIELLRELGVKDINT